MRISISTGCENVPVDNTAELSYDIFFFSSGKIKVDALFSPTLDFHGKSLRYAIALDDEPFKEVELHGQYSLRDWETWVADNIIRSGTIHYLEKPGLHTLRIKAVDPFLVLQRLEIDTGGLLPSYLGPPESYHNGRNEKEEDGYELWLRYRPLNARMQDACVHFLKGLYTGEQSAVINAAVEELYYATERMTGFSLKSRSAEYVLKNGGILAGTWNDRIIKNGFTRQERETVGPEGYTIKSIGNRLYIAGSTHIGVMYGVFHLLRLMQTGQCLENLLITENPAFNLRILNHWDNPDRSIERGYAGLSLWEWEELPGKINSRYRDYARANASIGINATVLNNVNADACFLTPVYLEKIAVLADVFRDYASGYICRLIFLLPES